MKAETNLFWQNFKTFFLKENKKSSLHKIWLESITSLEPEKKKEGFLFTLQAPSKLHEKWLKEQVLTDFYKYIHQFYKNKCKVVLEVAPQLPSPKKNPDKKISFTSKTQGLFFNSNYTFKNFVVGKNNKLAYGASFSITQHKKANENCNPLFIYSPSGLGKTHLLNAIGQQRLKKHPQNKVIYLSTERFLNEYINSLQNKRMNIFRKKFRTNCDLLLMDDIQIIAKGRGVQEEFFHTFNELYNQKSQIVICCDQRPGAVAFLEERIRTRLEGGLIADISYPDRETRIAILKQKTTQRGLFLSPQSLEQIAQTCQKSIREMEGVLNKIKMMTELHGGGLSLKEIENILSGIQKELTVEEIQKKTVHAFHISIENLKSPSRKKHIVRARQTAMFLIRKFLKKSLNDISLSFGKKDHTTVLNSIKKIEKLKTQDSSFKKLLEDLEREIAPEL